MLQNKNRFIINHQRNHCLLISHFDKEIDKRLNLSLKEADFNFAPYHTR